MLIHSLIACMMTRSSQGIRRLRSKKIGQYLLALTIGLLMVPFPVKSDQIYLDFETFPVDPDGPGGYNAGDAIPGGESCEGFVLNDAFRLLGLRLESSGGGGIVAFNFLGIAVSGFNWILACPDNPSHIVFTFRDPVTDAPQATDYFSLATDTQPDAEQSRLSAFDVAGNLIATTGIVTDTTSATLSLNVPGMHKLVFETISGNPGIGVDDVRFNRPTPPPTRISGRVTLQNSVNQAQPLTFEFRPTDGSPNFLRMVTLNHNRTFTISNIPPRSYRLWVKGVKWLATSITVDTTNGDVSDINLVLRGGDANDDNNVDVFDLDLLIQAFNSMPTDANWNQSADFNCDDFVDVFDLDMLVHNFNETGDL
jgi:hypothetical protein